MRDLRISVGDVLGWLAQGMTAEQVLADYPELTHENLRACLAYAAAREAHEVRLREAASGQEPLAPAGAGLLVHLALGNFAEARPAGRPTSKLRRVPAYLTVPRTTAPRPTPWYSMPKPCISAGS